MAYEPRRTLLVALSALAVVFAAALFPAAGVGTHPGGDVGVPVAPAGPSTTVPSDPTPTPTVVETPEATPTEPPPPDQGSGGDLWPDLSLVSLLGAAAKGGSYGLIALAVVVLGLFVRGVEPGTPRVELPFGLTLTLPFTVPAWVGRLGTSVSRLTMGFVVAVSASVTQLLDAVGAAGRAVASGLGIVAGEGLRGTVGLLAGAPRVLAGSLAGLAALPTTLASLPGALSTVGDSVQSSPDRPGEDAREVAPDPVEPDESTDSGPPGVAAAWVAMTDLLPVERGPTTTPSEYARRAVDRGFPAAPIERLTRAFEDVTYGGYEPGDRTAAARDALASLRDRLGGGG